MYHKVHTVPLARRRFTFAFCSCRVELTIRGLPDKETANSPWRGCRTIDKGALGATFGVIRLGADAKVDLQAGVC